MGQITNPIVLGISVLPTDRQSGLLAGGGATGNDAIFLGQLAGQNSTISNFIAIGHHAADGGITDAANLNGTTVLGANSLGALTTGAANALPLTVIGSAVANSLVNGDSSVLIGSKILSLYAGTGGTAALANSVIIGNNLMPTATGIAAAVSNVIMIGNNIFPNVTGFGAPAASIFIGNNILQGIGNNVGTTNSIYIGQTSGSGITGATAGNIIIGTAAQQLVGTNTTDGFNIIIGNGATSTGAFNVVLGAGAKSSANLVGVGNVIIGSNAGLTLADDHQFTRHRIRDRDQRRRLHAERNALWLVPHGQPDHRQFHRRRQQSRLRRHDLYQYFEVAEWHGGQRESCRRRLLLCIGRNLVLHRFQWYAKSVIRIRTRSVGIKRVERILE